MKQIGIITKRMLEEAKDQSHISLEEDRQSLKKKER
jgi:hypothetical protein